MFTFLKVWFCVHNFRFREHVTTGGTGGTLAYTPFVSFGDAVMYDGALIWFKYEDDFGFYIFS